MTKIEWTDESWNPVTGCTKCSPGCANCYADATTKIITEIVNKVVIMKGDDIAAEVAKQGQNNSGNSPAAMKQGFVGQSLLVPGGNKLSASELIG